MIKVFLFDIGDVIFDDGYVKGTELFEKDNNIPKGKLYHAIHGLACWKDFTKGEVSEENYWQDAKAKVKIHLNKTIDIQNLRHYVFSNMIYHPEIIDYIKKLKPNYKIGVVSNFTQEWFNFLDKKYLLRKYFDVVSISGITGVRKPKKAAFDYALKKLKIKPQEAVFIDDKQKYVDIVRDYGLIGLRYSSLKQLKNDIIRLTETK